MIEQNDIFVIKEAEKIAKAESGIPTGYVPVKFSSKDKLGPEILHFRNYSMGEMLELASAVEENQLNILTNRVLNALCYEKYDCTLLHIENVKEIMLTLYANFWGTVIKGKPFYKKLDLEDNDVEENIGYADIDIQKLNIKDIDLKFKVPFTIIDDVTGQKVKFTMPIVKHTLIAEKFVKEKYKKKEEKYRVVKSLLETKASYIEKKLFDELEGLNIDESLVEELEQLEMSKAKDFMKVSQAQLLVGVGDNKLESIEEKLEAFETAVDSTTWVRYTETLKKYADFGISDDYEFMYDGELVSRRFSFRFVDFVPSMDETRHTGYTVQFDD